MKFIDLQGSRRSILQYRPHKNILVCHTDNSALILNQTLQPPVDSFKNANTADSKSKEPATYKHLARTYIFNSTVSKVLTTACDHFPRSSQTD